MGGKNAIIVDADADLDVAVGEVVVSAFHYSGQKCSAASRVIVLEPAYDDFVRRLVEATRSLAVGPPENASRARRPGHQRRREGQDRGLHRAGQARGDAGRRRRAARRRLARRRLLRRPPRLRRRAAERGHRAGGDLRPRGRRPEGRRHGRSADHRQRRQVRPHRRPHQPQPGDHRARSAASSASATSTSTGASPERSSSASRSAASR